MESLLAAGSSPFWLFFLAPSLWGASPHAERVILHYLAFMFFLVVPKHEGHESQYLD